MAEVSSLGCACESHDCESRDDEAMRLAFLSLSLWPQAENQLCSIEHPAMTAASLRITEQQGQLTGTDPHRAKIHPCPVRQLTPELSMVMES